jgi:outer membrane protein assembly factor BamD (BamD/ComL family)
LHQRRFPSGELTAERLFLRADAYRRLGRTTDAHREADALVKSFPSSAYARLVADVVDPPAAPKP